VIDRIFPANEHTIDRTIRVLLGITLLLLPLSGGSAWGYLGIVPLVTGLVGSCPVYTLLGISTCPLKATSQTR
jgi:hypothetical protein